MAQAVILIGFMGSGKTAAGRELARLLDWDFIDADEVVVERMGISIPEAFSTRGEGYFRGVEEEEVLDLLTGADRAEGGLVLSLGGGAVTSKRVRELLKQQRLVVLLDTDIDTAFERAGGGSRPLARERSAFRELYQERSYLYRQAARFSVDTGNKDPKAVASEIAAIVRETINE